MNAVKAIKNKREKEKIIKFLQKKHGKYMVLFLIGISTGLRVSDILHLKVKDVLFGSFSVREQKTQKFREFDFSEKQYTVLIRLIVEHVERYNLQLEDYLVFSNPDARHRPLSRTQAWRVLHAAGASAGLQGIATHSMRKTFARERFEASGDLLELQGILNHKHMSTTLMYLFSLDELNGLKLR